MQHDSRSKPRILRVLEKAGRCMSIYELAGAARLTPSEVLEVARKLEKRGLLVIHGDFVCCTSCEDAHGLPAELDRVLRDLSEAKHVVAKVELRPSLRGADFLILLRNGVAILAKYLGRRSAGQTVHMVARRVAREARRVAEEGSKLAERGYEGLCLVVPLVVVPHGAPRVVEGVLVRPIARIKELVLDTEQVIADPRVRLYMVEGGGRCRRGASYARGISI
ncbi:MAG: hypothetical protein ABWW70_05590 [Thermoproteota archaeon]